MGICGLNHFPPYAPELNPDEGIWNYLKNVLDINVRSYNTRMRMTDGPFFMLFLLQT